MKTVAVILGGGQGSRLMPLTSERSKPAVPIAGKYRLVDIPISSCINSGIRQIYVLTQFNSESLHRHIQRAYRFDAFSNGYVSILAAQQTPSSEKWFQGTADAVRQGFRHFMDDKPDLIAVLSGDQLYRIDFKEVIERHISSGAEISICTKPVSRGEAGALGIMQVDGSQRVLRFVEKPGDSAVLNGLRAPLYTEEKFLASMGIYIFNAKVLAELLQNDMVDFGKHIIPHAIERRRVFSYIYDGYWKDIGTIHSFWEENLALAESSPPFDFFDNESPIYTDMRFLPPSKVIGCELERCLLSEGCIISGRRIIHSVVGIRARVGVGTIVENSVLMGADYFESLIASSIPAVGIGRDCYIRNAIVDKNARIGDGCHITPDGKPNGTSTPLYSVRDGVIVIPKNVTIPSGTRI